MSEMFSGLEESTIMDGNFAAKGDSKMFEESKKLQIGGGTFLVSADKKGKGLEESESEDEGPEMFKGLEQSTLTNGVFVSQGSGKMFEKSKNLFISGGNYSVTGTGTKARKSKNTAKPSQQGYRSAQPGEFHGSSSSIRVPYNPTPVRQPLLPQSVPAEPSGSTFQGFSTFGASVPLTHTQTVPALPSDAKGYFQNYDVPNHRVQQAPTNVGQGSSSTNFAATPMDVDANNEDSSEFDKGNGKKKDKDNKFFHGIKWKKQGE